MKTDDFLADLEAQLSGARPRRRPPAVLLVVPVVAALIALATLAGGDDTETEVVAPPAPVEVLVLNGDGDPRAGAGAVASLRANGYAARLGSPVDERARTQVDFSGEHAGDAEIVADLVGTDRVVHVFGADLPDVVVTLGNDSFARTVFLRNASGDPTAADRAEEELVRAGFRVEDAVVGPVELISHFEASSGHLAEAGRAMTALQLSGQVIELGPAVDTNGAVLVTLGTEYAAP